MPVKNQIQFKWGYAKLNKIDRCGRGKRIRPCVVAWLWSRIRAEMLLDQLSLRELTLVEKGNLT